ncbi:MAG: 4Fe-4S dicluster domain-containing protein [Pseudomonadota bacterium]|nr:4Fe-4S dicluster domain-containing protein [Pseudomonadota bacterium]
MQSGLLSTYHSPKKNRSGFAWAVSLVLFAFYFLLYLPDYGYFPDYLNLLLRRAGFVKFDKWNAYGLLYSVAMIVGGWFMLQKHGNSRYHRLRTYCLVAVQVVFAFSLPLVLKVLDQPELYLSYLWPLSYDKLFPDTLAKLPIYAAVYFVVTSLVVFPLLAFYKGKRFYCSWICGCGGLAETFGDPWRHLSSKSDKAWRIEQVTIYSVLALVLLTTGLMIADASSKAALLGNAGTEVGDRVALSLSLANQAEAIRAAPADTLSASVGAIEAEVLAAKPPEWLAEKLVGVRAKATEGDVAGTAAEVKNLAYAAMPVTPISGIAHSVKGFYAFFIGALFSGAAGVGLYPLMGTRVWCRFGCPMAAVLGLIQRFGRFRITVKKDMCISCGNCSTYCEMGIDVRQYAMGNLDIKRASCVGCGMCAHVCPRGVLKLETRKDSGPAGNVQVWTLDL